MRHTLLYWFPWFVDAGAAGLYLGLADAWSSFVFGVAVREPLIPKPTAQWEMHPPGCSWAVVSKDEFLWWPV